MDRKQVREFKAEAMTYVLRDMIELMNVPGSEHRICPPALGLHPLGENAFELAIRVNKYQDMPERAFEKIQERAREQGIGINFKEIGAIHLLSGKKIFPNELQQCVRPLHIGLSIAQAGSSTKTGTLGCFVKKSGDSKLLVLSNSHILAYPEEKIGYPIIQPGGSDNGNETDHTIGKLNDFCSLTPGTAHSLDAAIAEINHDIAQTAIVNVIERLGKLTLRDNCGRNIFEDQEQEVMKLGRATALTRGKISAIELEVRTSQNNNSSSDGLIFENQIEIESTDMQTPFSQGGDSGSIIFQQNGEVVGLLFAANVTGRLAYANPIESIKKRFEIEIA